MTPKALSREEILEEIAEIELALAEGGPSYQEMIATERLVWLNSLLTKENH